MGKDDIMGYFSCYFNTLYIFDGNYANIGPRMFNRQCSSTNVLRHNDLPSTAYFSSPTFFLYFIRSALIAWIRFIGVS